MPRNSARLPPSGTRRNGSAPRAIGAAAALAAIGACGTDLPVDDATENPGISAPLGVIRGTVTYVGPGPCIRDGHVEGALVVLLFDYRNPPPPDGLATTALNFATIPGERLFESVTRPTSGPGSPGGGSWCPSLASAPVVSSAPFSLQQLQAGRYQIRAFYSRQNRFFPLFDFANLPVAGDVGGGALVDPRALIPQFAPIQVGVPDPRAPDGPLRIPPRGYLADGVSVVVGQVLTTSRPYFNVDLDASRGFVNEKPPASGEKGVPYPNDDPAPGAIVFPQDHPLTSQQNFSEGGGLCVCIGETCKPPKCDVFKFAEASFPAIRFRYGFPGDASRPDSVPADAWLAKNAKPTDPVAADRLRPFYGIDPLVGDLPQSKTFALTRAFGGDGKPAILHDNDDLEMLGEIAELYPLVVLAKLKQDPDGNLADPPTPQTDPAVIIQAITLRGNSLKATSQGQRPDGGLRDPAQPLSRRGAELAPNFTALVRTAALCIPAGQARGDLIAPFRYDFNPDNLGKELVTVAKVKATQPRVREVQFGCLPPGYYGINVVYQTGQAWSLPNQMGACGFSTTGKPIEECFTPASPLPAAATSRGFQKRPLLASQQAFKTDAAGNVVVDAAGRPAPQIVYVSPSLRCMSKATKDDRTTVWTNHPENEDVKANGIFDPKEDKNGNGIMDLKVPEQCMPVDRSDPARPKPGATFLERRR